MPLLEISEQLPQMQTMNLRWARKKARIQKGFKGNAKRRRFARAAENYDKAKLKGSGLWDESAAKKAAGSLVVYRVDQAPPTA